MTQLTHFIGGTWREPLGERSLEARNPADDSLVAVFADGNAADVDAAVRSARSANADWAALTVTERIAQLRGFIDGVEALVPELARLEHLEMGKPEAMAAESILGSVAAFRAALDDAATYPFSEELDAPSGTTLITRSPRGTIAQIVPWNFTVAQILGALAPLLATGNCVIVKPSEKSTPSAVAMFEANHLPEGVLNLVLGAGEAGAALSAHPDIDGVLFTGSVATGRKVAAAATVNLNPVVLELGGKDAAIVDEGVDLKSVAQDVALGAFLNSGQICASIELLYLHSAIAEEFLALLIAELSAYQPGGSMEIGPLVDRGQRASVHGHVSDALQRGAQLLIGGQLPEGPGAYYPITLVRDIDDSMLISQEETFGPVLGIRVVPDFASAMEQAARSKYGLAATVYTTSDEHIRDAAGLPVGYVWVNGWQGSAGLRLAEPHGVSGMGAVGHRASFDNAVRPRTIFVPKGESL